MKIQILLCFIFVFISIVTASSLPRTYRQINSEEISDETDLTSDRWGGWSWGETVDRPTIRTTRRPSPSVTTSTIPSTTRSTTRSTTTTSSTTDTSYAGSTTKSSTIRPSISTSIPITSSATPVTSSSPSPAPIVTPNPVTFNRCMASCMRTNEYNPLCANLGNGLRKQYGNDGEMNCANFCGESSTFLFRGTCVSQA